ncbi:MAG TPA: methyltransferase domain-containing protein [Acidimicrobiales bacterium]
MLFVCPLDRSPFDTTATGVRCGLGHTFDWAREGYLHLLPGGRKAGGVAGDSPEMLRARRDVFDRGHYSRVMTMVADHVAVALTQGEGDVLDAGCGEGSYLHAIHDAVPLAGCWGVDVAKTAVRMAARRYRHEAGFAVASSYQLPVADHTVDAVVSVFAPRAFAEFGRVLKRDGTVVVASPGPDHLAGLKALIYNDPRSHAERPHATGDDAHAPPARRDRVRYELALRPPTIVALLQMTPYWWHARPDQQAALAERDELSTTVDVIVTSHRLGS